MRTDFIWLDPSKAEVIGLKYDEWLHLGPVEKRVRHPDLPGVRWMSRSRKGNGWYSRYTQALAYGGSLAEVYFLPTKQAWEQRQQRISEAA